MTEVSDRRQTKAVMAERRSITVGRFGLACYWRVTVDDGQVGGDREDLIACLAIQDLRCIIVSDDRWSRASKWRWQRNV